MREDTMKAKAWDNRDIGKWFHLWSSTLTVALLRCSNMYDRIIRLIWREVKTFVRFHCPGELAIIPVLIHLLDYFHHPSPTGKYLTPRLKKNIRTGLLAFLVEISVASFSPVTRYHLKALLLLAARLLEACGQNHQRQNGCFKQLAYMVGSGVSWVCLVLLSYQRWRRRNKTPFGHPFCPVPWWLSECHC